MARPRNDLPRQLRKCEDGTQEWRLAGLSLLLEMREKAAREGGETLYVSEDVAESGEITIVESSLKA